LITSASFTYWASPLWRRAYSFSDSGLPPRFCAGRGWGRDAFYDLYCAYLGEQPPPRKVEGETEHAALQRSVLNRVWKITKTK
jgi:hypothetical protein